MLRHLPWKIIAATGAVLSTLALVFVPQTKALADTFSGDVLADIRNFTFTTSWFAAKIESDLTLALVYLNEWLITPSSSDPSPNTGQLQTNFATYTNTIMNTEAINNTLQAELTTRFLGPDVTPDSAPYANDFTYQTLLGSPYFNPDPRLKNLPAASQLDIDPARNYVSNAAGLRIQHILPRTDFKGSDADKKRYSNFYNTVSAIQTFNIHVLGEMYADYKSDGAASAQQANLIQQASNSNWFSVIASEHIGLVLRQILMYNSQLLVVATQLLQTQKEALAAQAMTNTLLVLGNEFNETLLLGRATGQIASQ